MEETEILEMLSIERDVIAETLGSTRLNKTLSEYYLRLYHEYNIDTALSESERVLECSNKWLCDCYEQSNVSDVKYVSHCRSRFCLTCQKLIQGSRLNRFAPILVDAARTYDLYHIVFSIPNVPGVKLKAAVRLMAKAFKRLIIFISGRKNIAGLDFTPYGFYACLRALEVTYHTKVRKNGTIVDDDFHPHYHCIFAFKKGLVFEKTEINAFSYDDGILTDKFSKFEVLIQKLWRLIVDSEREKVYRYVEVTDKLGKSLPITHPLYGKFTAKPKKKNKRDGAITLAAIDSLELGYSCKMSYIEPDEDKLNFYEVFKYAFKITSEEQELFTYNQFVSLYFGLKNIRTIQGYGAWSKLKSADDFDDSVDEFYGVLIGYLRQREQPYVKQFDLNGVLDAIDNSETVFITKKSLMQWLKRADERQREEFAENLGNPQPFTASEKHRKVYITDIMNAFYRYLTAKRTSDLFADIREQERKAKEEKQVLTLTPEQLSFLNSIF